MPLGLLGVGWKNSPGSQFQLSPLHPNPFIFANWKYSFLEEKPVQKTPLLRPGLLFLLLHWDAMPWKEGMDIRFCIFQAQNVRQPTLRVMIPQRHRMANWQKYPGMLYVGSLSEHQCLLKKADIEEVLM